MWVHVTPVDGVWRRGGGISFFGAQRACLRPDLVFVVDVVEVVALASLGGCVAVVAVDGVVGVVEVADVVDLTSVVYLVGLVDLGYVAWPVAQQPQRTTLDG